MIPLSINTNIEQAPWTDLAHLAELGRIERIGRLPRGMTSGKSSVTIVIRMKDGTQFMGETSLALMNGAMQALNGADAREAEERWEQEGAR